MSCRNIDKEIDEARAILKKDGKEALLKYCQETFGENDGAGMAEDIIELWGE